MRFSDWPISIDNWVYIFHRVLSDPYSDVLWSEEGRTNRLLVCCKMFAFFKAIFKLCTAKILKQSMHFCKIGVISFTKCAILLSYAGNSRNQIVKINVQME